jgi:hypothetical protein
VGPQIEMVAMKLEVVLSQERRKLEFEVAEFNGHSGDVVRRTAEPEIAMAIVKPEVVLSQERHWLQSKFRRRFICFRGRRVQWAQR